MHYEAELARDGERLDTREDATVGRGERLGPQKRKKKLMMAA
jgi:hypothetical protein